MKNHGFLPAATAALLILTACLAVADTTTNRYVVKDNPNAAPPYHAWTNAAPDIQTAIDAAIAANNDQVIVAPGVYDSGATWGGANSNRVYVKRGITVMSRDNDPATTIIKGAWDPVTTNGPQAVRCVFLEAAAKIIGFTLTNGATASFTNTVDRGGGVDSVGTTCRVSNCIVTGNSACVAGGIYWATVDNSLIESNLAYQGAGTMFATLHNCVIRNNKAIYQASNQRGGGIIRGSAYNSLIEGNVAGTGGGGWNTILYNCTIVNNTGSSKSSGTYQCTLYNCISWNNVDYENTVAYYSRGDEDLYLTNNCTQADPLFIDAENGDWRLRGSSPCIDTGTNQTWMTTARDLDGRPRLNSAPDMGCYEYWPQATMLIMH